MSRSRIALLHPGSMGISIAATLKHSGHDVCWLPLGRSRATRQRAEQYDLTPVEKPEQLIDHCDLVLSICPPHAALEVAAWVGQLGFDGLYLDANAVSPARSVEIGALVEAAGADYVDGGVIGGPAWQPGTTWLHLAGGQADKVAELFSAGPLQTNVLGDQVGQASALKMVFAAQTKGSSALTCATLAAAKSLGVAGALQQQWQALEMGLAEQAEPTLISASRKAWRFAGEMDEIAETFAAAGIPAEFHQAAAQVFRRMVGFENSDQPPVDELLSRIAGRTD